MYIGVSQFHASNERMINERIQRRNATEAYRRDEKYHKPTSEQFAEKLMADLIGDEKEPISSLEAGQMKQVHLPLGKSLEETIWLWQDVRAEALASPEPTTTDYQLASKASSNIRQAEAQLGLNRQANSEVDAAIHLERQSAFTRMAEEFSTPIEETIYNHKEKYKRAVTAYTFQVQLKLNGFKVNTPSFLKIA